MAILRSLLVNLGLNSSQYRKDLDSTKNKTQSSFKGMMESATKFKGVVLGAMSAISASSAAMVAKQVRDQDNLARLSGLTINEYRKLSYAAEQYGISAEQIKDQTKDTIERIGEYINAASGGLQDFGDSLGWSKKETLEFAKSVKDLSGTEVLQRMVNEMEKAGLTTGQMSHALEGMGSDLTALIPLFTNNGEEMNRLAEKYERFNGELSPEKVAQYRRAAEDIDLMTTSLSNMLTVALVPVIEGLYEAVKGYETLHAAANGDKKAQLFVQQNGLLEKQNKLMSVQKDLIEKIKQEGEDGKGFFDKILGGLGIGGGSYGEQLKIVQDELRGVSNELMNNAKSLATLDDAANRSVKPNIPKLGDPNKPIRTAGDDAADKEEEQERKREEAKKKAAEREFKRREQEAERMAQQIIDRNKTQEKLWEEEEKALNDYFEKKLISQAKFDEAKLALKEEAAKREAEIERSLIDIGYQSQIAMIGGIQQGFSQLASLAEQGSGLQKAMFLASQAAAAANVWVSSEQALWNLNKMALTPVQLTANEGLINTRRAISLAAIASQTVAGVMHDGGVVPDVAGRRESTWLLQSGEQVLSRSSKTNIEKMLENGGAGGATVNVYVQGNIYGDKETNRIIADAARKGFGLVQQDIRSGGNTVKFIRGKL